jgi:hypothetical protein
MRRVSFVAAVSTLVPMLVSSRAESHEWGTIKLPTGEIGRLGDPVGVSQDTLGGVESRQLNLALILDASGSMNAALPAAGKPKLVVAKEVLQELVQGMEQEISVALWIYGHRHPQEPKDRSCQDIENVLPLRSLDREALVQEVEGVTAIGYTPIAEAVRQAAEHLPRGGENVNSIILLSDGEETCGGDPCALAAELKEAGDLTTHVVGYAVDEAAREQLHCIAKASGGGYWDAEDASDLLLALEEAVGTAAAATLLRVEVVGPDSQPLSADFHLHEPASAHRIRGYVGWQDHTIAPGEYDLVVWTLPPVLYSEVPLPRASTTVVRFQLSGIFVKTPAGGGARYGVHDAPTNTRLGAYGDTTFVAPGTYKVKVNNSISRPLEVRPGDLVEVLLGAIRTLSPSGEAQTVDVCDSGGTRLGSYGGDVLVAPGIYRVEIHNSRSDTIRVPEGETVELVLGTIRAVTPDGKSVAVDIYDAENHRLGSYGGDVLVVPGTYAVGIHNSRSDPVPLGPGESTEVVLGAIRTLGPDGEPVAVTYYDSGGKRLGSYGEDVLLVPGTYELASYHSKSAPVEVQAGATTEVVLGAVEMPTTVELSDALGRRLGSYGGTITLFPGTYLVKTSRTAPAESVEVRAGEVTRLK